MSEAQRQPNHPAILTPAERVAIAEREQTRDFLQVFIKGLFSCTLTGPPGEEYATVWAGYLTNVQKAVRTVCDDHERLLAALDAQDAALAEAIKERDEARTALGVLVKAFEPRRFDRADYAPLARTNALDAARALIAKWR